MSTDSFSDNRRKRHIYMDSKLDDLPLTMEAYRVYCHLCRRAGCDNNAFPSYKSIGEACFRGSFPHSPTDSLRRKAIAAVNELIAWNLVNKTSRSFDGLQTSNHYSLTDMEDWFTRPTSSSTLIRGSKSLGGAGGTLGGVLGEHPPSAGGTPLVVLGGHPGSAGGTPKDYPIEDYPIEDYPVKREERPSVSLDLSLPKEISFQTEQLVQPTRASQVERLVQPIPVPQVEKLDQLTPVSQLEKLDQPAPDSQVEKLDQLTLDFQLEKPDQPTPQIHSLLPKQPESLQQKSDPAFGSIVAGSFDNLEQMNLPLASTQDTTAPKKREVLTLQRYQQLDADGIPLTQWELRDWAKQEIGQYVKTYRKSGSILTGGNDVSVEFAVYVAKQNCKRGQQPTISLGFSVINKCERDPRCWQKLVGWVTEWQQQRQTKTTVNVAAAVNHQQELDRIRQAANTKFEL
ncbi:hypothetical protein NOS3756_57130 (plasmid) [Nostoc sp. NIES-3756]|uniref:hypothetical protein n=1 Tax=Nostoc sp. NIES-3756 TaxID=1751286 RepID=UPI00071FE2B3|nr:hypothetical protein [Nostoc sp. NIES-3756]BAT56701.1 hypothetical protein NOS3756_57130 [Nostoc sp. NIES-3756]